MYACDFPIFYLTKTLTHTNCLPYILQYVYIFTALSRNLLQNKERMWESFYYATVVRYIKVYSFREQPSGMIIFIIFPYMLMVWIYEKPFNWKSIVQYFCIYLILPAGFARGNFRNAKILQPSIIRQSSFYSHALLNK